MNEIGRNLKRIRLLKNLSLEKAGNLLNMSAPAIAKYEKGKIVPNSEKLIEFANAYSVKVLDLLKTHSALLMPKEAIINEFGISRNNISFYELRAFKQEYKVSMAAIVYRLKELGIIKEHLFKKINISFSANGLKKHEPYPIDPEESYQLNRIVHKLEVDKIISLNRACELLDITLNEYNNEDNNYRY